MRSKEYWKKRSEAVLLVAERKGNDLVRELNSFYSETTRLIQRDVEAFYGRYASDNAITIQEAKKRLTAPQLEDFHAEMERYYAEAGRVGLGKDYKDYLRRLSGRGYISRQEELLAQVRHQTELLANRELESFMGTLSEVYEHSYYRTIFDTQQGLGFGADFNRLDHKTLESVIRRPWLGDSFSDRIWKQKNDLLMQLDRIIPQAFATGRNSRELGQWLAKRMGTSRYNGERLARTEVNHAANEATRASYKELGVDRYEFLATLDSRTSEACASLDGKVFRVTDAQVGTNYPPMHPNCRSTTVPYFEPDEFDEPTQRAARDVSGKYYTVPASMTYAQWQKKYIGEKLTRSEKRAINTYTGPMAYSLNAKLRDGISLTQGEIATVEALDSALEKLPKYAGTVQRSLFFDTNAEVNSYVMSLLSDGFHPAYTSASTSVYDENDSIRLIIQSKSAADLRGFNRREQEVLFTRGMTFQVVNIGIVDGKRTIWLEEVSDV